MDDLIENALRIMVSLARLPALEPATVAELLGVRLHPLRASPYRVDYGATGPFDRLFVLGHGGREQRVVEELIALDVQRQRLL
jgi:hypothetical protein